jgi:Na+/H+ antiporter NhaA
MTKSNELMSVGFNLTENGMPNLIFCSEFSVPVTNKTFVSSFVKYYENNLKFKLGHLSCSTLAFSWISEEEDILEVHFKKNFMGLALSSEIYKNMVLCLNQLNELNGSYGQERID